MMNKDEYLEELLKDLIREQQKYLNHMKKYIVIDILIVVFEMLLFFMLLGLIFK